MIDGFSAGGNLGPGALAFISAGLLGESALSDPAPGLTPFDARIGALQGRIAAAVGMDQERAFVLGDAVPGRRAYDLAAGDRVEISQAVDVTDDALIRFDLRLFVPRSTPEGWAWKVCLLLDGEPVATARGWPGVDRAPGDLVINVAALEGEHTIGVRLELEGE